MGKIVLDLMALGFCAVVLFGLLPKQTLAFLKDFQTLIGAATAILAAIIGGMFINRQIRATIELERQRRLAKFDAARAMLPLHLNEVTRYCRQTGRVLRRLIENLPPGELIEPENVREVVLPELPKPAATALRDLIEYTDDSRLRDVFSTLLSKLQIQHARLSDLPEWADDPAERIWVKTNVEQAVIDVAEIHARTESLFSFARRRSETAPLLPSFSTISVALSSLGFLDYVHVRVFDKALRHEEFRRWPNHPIGLAPDPLP